MRAPVDPEPSLGGQFALRPVALREAGELLHAALAPYRAAPLRLSGMFLLLWVPTLALVFLPTFGPFLSETVSAVVFAGYTAALDAAARSEPPDFRHVAVVLRFGRDRLTLLALTGLLPVVCAVLVLYAVWGVHETAAFLDQLTRGNGRPSPGMMLDFQAAEYVASMPFTFAAPVWALYRWSGSRCMAANLLASWVNWRWVLAMTGFMALSDNLLLWLRDQGEGLSLLSNLGVIAVAMLTLSWTLALAQRSFPSR